MYIPKQFEEVRLDVMHELIRAYPLATIISQSEHDLNANHIPLFLSAQQLPFGVLHGHVARANSLLEDVGNNSKVLAIFQGPDAYITPSWYATKKETGKVVPTWNYAVVHVYGTLKVIDDPKWLRQQLEVLTAQNESKFSEQWAISDAPQEFIENIMAGIVGIEIIVTKILGKWKVSQNQPVKNQNSVIEGLKASGTPDAVEMADLVALKAQNVV